MSRYGGPGTQTVDHRWGVGWNTHLATVSILIYLPMSRYGGPGTQTVDHRWGVGWNTYLASKRDFVVANIDVRGSGFQVRRC